MKKSAIALFFAAFLSLSALAQSVQEGINHFYAQRYASAKSTFERLLAANPNNIEATYWLGQTYLEQKNVAGAKSLYEKALMTNGNAPLLMVGMGSVELLEGKSADARARFENAINSSKGKKGNDATILNAVGRANVFAYTEKNRVGDLDYAIAKLQEAAQIAPNNADVFLNLGNAYRKKGNKGGDAIQAYRQAVQLKPDFAIAPYRAAMLYRTQLNSYRDPSAWSVVVDNLNAAIAADPKFAPAYEELYNFNLFGKADFSAAENLAKQYVSNADPSVENDYLVIQTYIVQKKYAEAITAAKNIVAQTNNNPRPRVYRALAVASMGVRDSSGACGYISQFLSKASEEDLLSSDYIIHAQTCGKGNPGIIKEDVVRALQIDTALGKQLKTLNEWIDDAKAARNSSFEAELRLMSYQLRQSKNAFTSATELISYVAIPFYLGGDYRRSDSVSKEYIRLAPDSIYGYNWSGRALAAIDTGAAQQGLFVPSLQKSLEIALTDTVRYATQGVYAASTLALYYANAKREYATAKDYAMKGLMFDRTNANLLNINRVLDGLLNRSKTPTTTPAPAPKTNTTTTPARPKGRQ